jgi:hypothetical protein
MGRREEKEEGRKMRNSALTALHRKYTINWCVFCQDPEIHNAT